MNLKYAEPQYVCLAMHCCTHPFNSEQIESSFYNTFLFEILQIIPHFSIDPMLIMLNIISKKPNNPIVFIHFIISLMVSSTTVFLLNTPIT